MKLIYFTDTHWRDEEPFFVAARKMADALLEAIKEQATEPFIVVHGGDVFHRSKETGRVNGLVVNFFTKLTEIKNCEYVYILQGNHDVKKETGSALDCLLGLPKICVIKEPFVKLIWKDKWMYFLPHMVPYSFENFKNMESYGNPEFHIPFISVGCTPDDIALTFAHIGDETSGEFFAQADLSFLPGIKCHGHIHKRVSANYPGSAMTTRRDEADQPCYLRIFDNDFNVREVKIKPAFNYLKVDFNDDLLEAYNNMEAKPYGAVVVDVRGHDNEEAAVRWFEDQKDKLPVPAFLGSVYPDDKISDGDFKVSDEQEAQEAINIREIFILFCKEKNVSDSVRGRLEAML